MFFEHLGTRMYYIKEGNGKPLLLLHGWGGSSESFLPLIRDMQSTRTVIAVDFPGHGNSPEPPCAWSVTEYMEMVAALIQYLRVEGTDVVAHSFGGRVALLFASAYPECVGKLVLTGCAGIPPKSTGKKKFRARVYHALKCCADNVMTRKLCPKRVEAWREALIQKFGSADYRALTPSMRQTFNRVLAQDLTPCLEKIYAPTLLVWGTEDTATPLWMGELMEQKIHDAALIRFEGVGHFAYLDKYADFLVIVRRFLTE